MSISCGNFDSLNTCNLKYEVLTHQHYGWFLKKLSNVWFLGTEWLLEWNPARITAGIVHTGNYIDEYHKLTLLHWSVCNDIIAISLVYTPWILIRIEQIHLKNCWLPYQPHSNVYDDIIVIALALVYTPWILLIHIDWKNDSTLNIAAQHEMFATHRKLWLNSEHACKFQQLIYNWATTTMMPFLGQQQWQYCFRPISSINLWSLYSCIYCLAFC